MCNILQTKCILREERESVKNFCDILISSDSYIIGNTSLAYYPNIVLFIITAIDHVLNKQ